MNVVNMLVKQELYQMMLQIIKISTVKEIARVPAYCLAFLSADLTEHEQDNEEKLRYINSSLKFDAYEKEEPEGFIEKRHAFTVDSEDLNRIREFIRAYSTLERPKNSYIIRLAIAYTLREFLEGRSENVSLKTCDIDLLKLIEKVTILCQRSEEENAQKKLIAIKKIMDE